MNIKFYANLNESGKIEVKRIAETEQPLGVIISLPAEHGSVSVVIGIELIVHYGKKYSVDMRPPENDLVDLLSKF